MKAVILIGVIGAISFGQQLAQAANQTVVIIPSFENRFAGPHAEVISITTATPTSSSSSSIIPVVSGATSQGQASSRTAAQASGRTTTQSGTVVPSSAAIQSGTRGALRLDASTMNIPVFPGNTTIQENPSTTVTVFPSGVGFPGTNFFGQTFGVGTNFNGQFLPSSAVPGPATNSLPRPAAPADIGRPAAVNGTTPSAQGVPVGPTPSGTTTIAPAPGTPATTPRTPADAVPSPAGPPRTR